VSAFFAEILPALQQRVLREVAGPVSAEGFYLAGGTALALHLGHRRSIDLDWFRAEAIADPLALAERLRCSGPALVVSSTARDTLLGSVEGVLTSFFAYRYRSLRPPVAWPEYGCSLAALEDLACMKLAAVAQRGARRDFVDLFAIIKTGVELGQMLDWFRGKYGMENVGHLLAALCYFDDAEKEPMPSMLVSWDWVEMKSTIAQSVRGCAG